MTAPTTVTPAPAAPAAPAPAAPAPAAPAEVQRNIAASIEARRAALTQALTPAAPTAPAEPAAPAETPAAPAAPAAEPATPAAEGEPAAPPAEGESPAAEPVQETKRELIIALPPRNEGEEAVEIEAPDQATADRLRHLLNGFQRSERVRAERAQLDQERDDVRQRRDQIEVDPTGFLMQSLTPEDVEMAALQLALHPNIWPNVGNVLKDLLETPEKLELARARLETMTLRRQDTLRGRLEMRRGAERNASDIKRQITALIPASMSDEQAGQFFDRALREVRDFAIRVSAEQVDVKYLPGLIAHICREYGLDPFAADGQQDSPPARPPQTPARPKVALAAPGGSKPPATTGAQLAEAAQKKAALAGVPPGGAAAGEPAPPPKQTVKERIAWLRGRR